MSNVSRNRTIYVVLFLVFLALFGAFFAVNAARSSSDTVMIDFPVIRTMVQDDDGYDHSVNVRYTLELTNPAAKNVNQSLLETALARATQNLKYNNLTSESSIDYVKSVAREELEKVISEEDLKGIYIADIGIDLTIEDPTSGSNQNIFKGLFPNAD